jgi:succinate-semialdehyde dehydrogenase/glutarate-semialdehyde dehydrogenase
MAIASIHPATGELLRAFKSLSDAQVDQKPQRAEEAFSHHRNTNFAERARMMNRAAEILGGEKEILARLMTTEMGKTFRSAVGTRRDGQRDGDSAARKGSHGYRLQPYA